MSPDPTHPVKGVGGRIVRRHFRQALAVALAVCMTAVAAPLPATGSVEALFTPWDDAEGAVLRELARARKQVYAQVYLLTSRAVARALVDACQRGVDVHVLADRGMLAQSEGSQVPRLAAAGIEVNVESRYAAAHNKVLLIDPEEPEGTVITGSYNYTWSAQARNAENLLVLRGNAALNRAYLDNWRRHRADALPYDAAMVTP